MARTQDSNDALFDSFAEPGDYKAEDDFKRLPQAKQWGVMADRGDVRSLLGELKCASRDRVSITEVGDHLHRALDVLAQTNPAAFGDFLTAESLSIAGMLLVHARFQLDRLLGQRCDERQNRGEWFVSAEFDAFTEKILTLQSHVAKIQQMTANTQRVLEQTRKLRFANEKIAAKKSRTSKPTRRQRLSAPRQPQTAPASRLSGGDFP
jgi:hypothetical protein